MDVGSRMLIAEGFHRFVSRGHAMNFVKLGWLPLPSLVGTVHEEYRVHIAWLCCCERRDQPPDPGATRKLVRASVRASRAQQSQYRQIAARRRGR
jgi:hypothetical protein